MEDPPIKSPVPLEEQKNCGGSVTEMRARHLAASGAVPISVTTRHDRAAMPLGLNFWR
jgi:hypothetical protein